MPTRNVLRHLVGCAEQLPTVVDGRAPTELASVLGDESFCDEVAKGKE